MKTTIYTCDFCKKEQTDQRRTEVCIKMTPTFEAKFERNIDLCNSCVEKVKTFFKNKGNA